MATQYKTLCLLALISLANPLRAEKVDMTPEQLRETATHVVTGQVIAVYTRTETMGDWRYARHVSEIRVDSCEKGDGIKKGDLIYARYWERAWIGKGQMPPSTSGHRGLPSDGESLRVYLARNAYDGFSIDSRDGGFNVIGANGFEKLKPESAGNVGDDADKSANEPETAAVLNVKADGVIKQEANESLIGYSCTRVFYTLADRHTVVTIVIDNQEHGFPAIGAVHQFADDVSPEDLAKWVNNQHSDALFADAPEPVATREIPATAMSAIGKKLPGQVQAGLGTWEKFSVKFAVEDTRLNSGMRLQKFEDAASVYVQVK